MRLKTAILPIVIPAKAGIHFRPKLHPVGSNLDRWIPAFAGMMDGGEYVRGNTR